MEVTAVTIPIDEEVGLLILAAEKKTPTPIVNQDTVSQNPKPKRSTKC